MQFIRLGEFYAVARITGSHDNLLQLQLSVGPQSSVTCEQLGVLNSPRSRLLDEGKVLAATLEGVAKANALLGTSYAVLRIRYIPNDSGPETVYGFLASSIIQHLHAGKEFGSAP